MYRAIVLLLAACASDPVDADLCGDGVVDGLEQCDDGNAAVGDGCVACVLEPEMMVAWSFYPSVAGPPMVGCRTGVATVELHQSLGVSRSFPCHQMHGWIPIPAPGSGRPLVFARLLGVNGETIAESVPRLALGDVEARFYEDAGFARIGWSFAPDGELATGCAESSPLRLTIEKDGTPFGVETMGCNPGLTRMMVVTDALPEGTYTFIFGGFHGDTTVTVPIGRNNAITDLDVTTP